MSSENRIFLMRPTTGAEELKAVERVFESRFLTEGLETQEFEKRVAEYVGVKHAVAVTSCTTALELALQVAGITRGTEVIIPDFTHLATGDAVLNERAAPVLVDVSEQSYNIDFKKAKSAMSKKVRCIIPVSLFGNPVDLEGQSEFLRKRDVVIIEDAACSLGSEINGKKVGKFADITCFSFHPRKLLTTGEGGMLVTDNDEYAELARSIKNFGIAQRGGRLLGVRRGSNYKMSNILAAIGLIQLLKFDGVLTERIKRARIYNDLLAGSANVRIPQIPDGVKSTYQSYCVMLNREGIRDSVRQRMREKGIEVQLGTNALHLEPVFSKARKNRLVNSTKVFHNTITLPLHNELTLEDQQRICFELDAAVRSLT